MKQVNLSRLHRTITRVEQQMHAKDPGCGSLVEYIRYTNRTSKSRVDETFEMLEQSRAKVEADVRKRMALLAYWVELKRILHGRNHKSGVDKLMVESASVKKQITLLQGLKSEFASAFQKHDVDFDKMTHEEIICTLDPEKPLSVRRLATAVTKDDLVRLDREIQMLSDKVLEIEDRIALLNQTTTVMIPEPQDMPV